MKRIRRRELRSLIDQSHLIQDELFGYLFREARVWERVFLVGAAVLLIKPGLITDLIGLGLIVAVGTSQLASRGAKPVANSRAVE